MTIKLAVFDVDGTLVDSRRTIAHAMDEAFTAIGLPAPGYEATRRIVGLSLVPAIQVLAPDLPPERYGALGEAYKNAFISLRAAQPHLTEQLYDGALDLIHDLKNDGWLLGVATGKARRGVDMFLDKNGLRGVFDAAYCADDGPGKPHPHMLECNIRALGADPARTVMIGDTSFDMAMARAAGVYAQGVAWGFHTIDEVQDGGAHHIAETFADLRAALRGFDAGHLR
jgi:phosphoglycolate phosphatase